MSPLLSELGAGSSPNRLFPMLYFSASPVSRLMLVTPVGPVQGPAPRGTRNFGLPSPSQARHCSSFLLPWLEELSRTCLCGRCSLVSCETSLETFCFFLLSLSASYHHTRPLCLCPVFFAQSSFTSPHRKRKTMACACISLAPCVCMPSRLFDRTPAVRPALRSWFGVQQPWSPAVPITVRVFDCELSRAAFGLACEES